MTCCGNCQWWEPHDAKAVVTELRDGECARFPPSVPCISRVTDLGVAVPEVVRGTVLMAQPTTYSVERCGEFRRATQSRMEE